MKTDISKAHDQDRAELLDGLQKALWPGKINTIYSMREG